MPNTASAAKARRNSERKRTRNRAVKSALHTMEKRFQAAVAAGKKDEATGLLPKLISAFDKAAKAGVIHLNSASRHKSRLSARVAALSAPAAAPTT